MPYFMVDGMRDGSNDPLYVEAMNADEALSKARKWGMPPTSVRPATTKYTEPSNAKLPLHFIGLDVSGTVALLIATFMDDCGLFFCPVMIAYLAISSVAQIAANSQMTIKKLQEEVAALREIVTDRKAHESEQPSPVG